MACTNALLCTEWNTDNNCLYMETIFFFFGNKRKTTYLGIFGGSWEKYKGANFKPLNSNLVAFVKCLEDSEWYTCIFLNWQKRKRRWIHKIRSVKNVKTKSLKIHIL